MTTVVYDSATGLTTLVHDPMPIRAGDLIVNPGELVTLVHDHSHAPLARHPHLSEINQSLLAKDTDAQCAIIAKTFEIPGGVQTVREQAVWLEQHVKVKSVTRG